MPVHCNRLWPSRAEALNAPRGDIALAHCDACGHIFNTAYEPEAVTYGADYENSLHYSPRFQRYAESLASRLVSDHKLHGKDIIEIGCGKGDFLAALARLGGNRCLGFDPSYESERVAEAAPGTLKVVRDNYGERHGAYRADVICCRHVLEHVGSPRRLVAAMRQGLAGRVGALACVEVPNADYMLRATAVFDVIYEHYSYFGARSLAHLFASGGFRPLQLREAFEGQFLWLEATPGEGRPLARPDPEAAAAGDIEAFADNYRAKVEAWRRRLAGLAAEGRRVVVWGAGSKGVTYLNLLDANNQVEYAVDLNPHKQGRHVPGTGQRIVSPDFLKSYQPGVVIVLNPVYLEEIAGLCRGLGLEAELLVA